MYVIVLKYVQLFCITVFFNSLNCDQLLLHNDREDRELYITAACVAKCLNSNITQVSSIVNLLQNISNLTLIVQLNLDCHRSSMFYPSSINQLLTLTEVDKSFMTLVISYFFLNMQISE